MNVEEEYLTLGRTFVLSNGYSLAVFHFSVCTRCSLNQSIKGPCHLISWVSATFPCFSSRLRSVWRESEFDLEWVGILTTLRTEPLFQVDDRKNNMKYFYSFRKSETTLKHENELESLTPIHSTLLERYQESNCYFFFFLTRQQGNQKWCWLRQMWWHLVHFGVTSVKKFVIPFCCAPRDR